MWEEDSEPCLERLLLGPERREGLQKLGGEEVAALGCRTNEVVDVPDDGGPDRFASEPSDGRRRAG